MDSTTPAAYRLWFAADMTAGDALFKRAAAMRPTNPDEARRLTDKGEAAYQRAEDAWEQAKREGRVQA